ncbi:MAG: aldo/keto reductase [Pyrinomonadaceae bacterium]|nr:aldo/keto reductase [Pyrinomonadaceae bacterium]
MNKRTLGKNLKVSAVGLGCMGMSEFYGAANERDDAESIKTIHRALEIGVNFLDTADMFMNLKTAFYPAHPVHPVKF